ncbi:peptide-methionine (S)-S-oxide reductase MsrA [Algoriphagus litoralis]|uniref:peptide-methionine (S)-S-oxide reductase MsrA n=1 Tax=Algoriphagus litoralis TaxID=2202829 RepID=UPI000DB9B828|nr:peptide-methionine (S)-S-oxide reductase MsrA [Algoriphagus litoralis]
MNLEHELPKTAVDIPAGLELITLGAGCFWCTEAVFQRLDGVEKVVSGYAGGIVPNPSYKQICTGTTGHAEVIHVFYNPEKISLESLLEVFWATHDPTTLNRQGADVGPQYRSSIFYQNENQKEIASRLKAELNASQIFDRPIVTEITAFSNFYPAENYHQDYFNLNGMQPYCQFVVKPKVDKLKKFFGDRLK